MAIADFSNSPSQNCKQTAEKYNQIFWILKKNLPPLKQILALPILGQICTDSELQLFTFAILQMEHLVLTSFILQNDYEIYIEMD